MQQEQTCGPISVASLTPENLLVSFLVGVANSIRDVLRIFTLDAEWRWDRDLIAVRLNASRDKLLNAGSA